MAIRTNSVVTLPHLPGRYRVINQLRAHRVARAGRLWVEEVTSVSPRPRLEVLVAEMTDTGESDRG